MNTPQGKTIERTCTVEGCEEKYRSKGYCRYHYQQIRKAGSIGPRIRNFHGLGYTRLAKIYYGIHARCENPKATYYSSYGGKGLRVCERWSGKEGLKNFVKDMGEPANNTLSIDRIDNAKGYSPDNCRWATKAEQVHNRSPYGKSGFMGVMENKNGRWRAYIKSDSKSINLGTFDLKIDAIKARIQAEITYWGKSYQELALTKITRKDK
jgi:AP2 domain.